MGKDNFIIHGTNTDATTNALIVNDFHLTKTGSAILHITNNNTYTSTTKVLEGELSVEGTTASPLFEVSNVARLSTLDKVITFQDLDFKDTGGINIHTIGSTLSGTIIADNVTQINPIPVDIKDTTNEDTHLILRTTETVDPILTLGINNSGHNARIETYGCWNYLTTGWGELLDIYDSGRQNISYQLHSPLAHLVGTTYAVTGGAMPTGLIMSTGGLITGTTPEVLTDTTFNFTVTAINGSTITHTYTWIVKAPIFEDFPVNTKWYAPPSYAPIQKIDAVIVGGGGGGRQTYGYGGGGAQVTQQVIDISSGHWVQMNIGNGGGQGANGGTSTFLKTDNTSVTATGGRGAVNSGNNTGSGLGGACCGSLTTYSPNRNGVTGTLIGAQFHSFLQGYFGSAAATRLGAGGGRGTWFGSVGSGGSFGGGRGGKSGSNNVVAGTNGTGSGGGGGTANSGNAGKSGGKGAIFIRY